MADVFAIQCCGGRLGFRRLRLEVAHEHCSLPKN